MEAMAPRQNAGSAYGRPQPSHDAFLSSVSAGTPAGEYLRRYWHPVGVSNDVTTRPQMVRVLGEDLVLFRDKKGRPGLLYPRCMHRGASLYYGKVDEEGIRCCYHGWLFDIQGNCLEQPCEPNKGANLARARQPWYPVQERYGLVFAYMGPPGRMPMLPHYDIFENLQPGEFLEVDGTGYGGYVDSVADPVIPYNWLQHWENVIDPYHVYVLHSTFSAIHFAKGFAVMPQVEFQYVDGGVIYEAHRTLPDGRKMNRVNAVYLPTIAAISDLDLAPARCSVLSWDVPIDDTHFRVFFVAKRKEPGRFQGIPVHDGKTWTQMTAEEHQEFPSDFEAQSGQGAITKHSEENLVTSDRGIAMLRRLMRQQIERVSKGQDPIGVVFEPKTQLVTVPAGNFYDIG